MELIRAFCGFSLASCAALLLLPEGSLRRAASLAFGLMTSLLWLQGLSQTELPDIGSQVPSGVLEASAASIDQEEACGELLSRAVSAEAGCTVRVQVKDGAITGITAYTDDEDAIERAAAVLSAARDDISTR